MQAVVGGRAAVFAARRVPGGLELRHRRLLRPECSEKLVQPGGDGIKARAARRLPSRVTDIARARLHPRAADVAQPKFAARRHPGFGALRFGVGTGHRLQQRGQGGRVDLGSAARRGQRWYQPVRQRIRTRRPDGQDDFMRPGSQHEACGKHPGIEQSTGLEG